jgi:hypothetical protein
MEYIMSNNEKKQSIIENTDPLHEAIRKLPFEDVDHVFNAMFFGFHPDGIKEKECADIKFVALWTLFLTAAGWTEDEFWEEDKKQQHLCPECGCPMEEHVETPPAKQN